MSEREEVLLEPAFVLHHRPFRNTSQLLECLTLNHGRVGLVAHGSRSPRGKRRPMLQPFVPLRVSWIRRGELGRLTNVERARHAEQLQGDRALAGFYVNELVLRLMARGDANSDAFSCYSECIDALTRNDPVPRALRLFELDLLSALGYGLGLDKEVATGDPLVPDGLYRYEIEAGLRIVDGASPESGLFSGRELISLRNHELHDTGSLRAAKRLLEGVLAAHLGERPLKSRSVFRDILNKGLNR